MVSFTAHLFCLIDYPTSIKLKNQNCHSLTGEESHVFLLNQKSKEEILHYVQDDKKGKLARILQTFSFSAETVPKIHIVILSEAKNLLFFFSSQKSKKRSF